MPALMVPQTCAGTTSILGLNPMHGKLGVRTLTTRPMTTRSMTRTNIDERCDIQNAVHGYYTLLDYMHGNHIIKPKNMHTKCKFICGAFCSKGRTKLSRTNFLCSPQRAFAILRVVVRSAVLLDEVVWHYYRFRQQQQQQQHYRWRRWTRTSKGWCTTTR